jgi:hypothetical protein
LVRGSLRLGLEIIGTLVAGLVIVAGFTAYRGRPFLRFLVLSAGAGAGRRIPHQLDDLVIAWTGGERLIGLRATHVRALANDGRSWPACQSASTSACAACCAAVAPTDVESTAPAPSAPRKDGHFQFLTAEDPRVGQPTTPPTLEATWGAQSQFGTGFCAGRIS